MNPITLTAAHVKLNNEIIEECERNAARKNFTNSGYPCSNKRGLSADKGQGFIGELGEAGIQLAISGAYNPTFDAFKGIDLYHDGIPVDVKTSMKQYPQYFYVSPSHLFLDRCYYFATYGSGNGSAWINPIGFLYGTEIYNKYPLEDIGNRNAPTYVIPTGCVNQFAFQRNYLIWGDN